MTSVFIFIKAFDQEQIDKREAKVQLICRSLIIPLAVMLKRYKRLLQEYSYII